MKLDAKSLGLAGGVLWGVVMFIMTWLSIFSGYGSVFLALMADIYPGYTISGIGSVIGLVYGFVDGFVGCFVLAWLYNGFMKS